MGHARPPQRDVPRALHGDGRRHARQGRRGRPLALHFQKRRGPAQEEDEPRPAGQDDPGALRAARAHGRRQPGRIRLLRAPGRRRLQVPGRARLREARRGAARGAGRRRDSGLRARQLLQERLRAAPGHGAHQDRDRRRADAPRRLEVLAARRRRPGLRRRPRRREVHKRAGEAPAGLRQEPRDDAQRDARRRDAVPRALPREDAALPRREAHRGLRRRRPEPALARLARRLYAHPGGGAAGVVAADGQGHGAFHSRRRRARAGHGRDEPRRHHEPRRAPPQARRVESGRARHVRGRGPAVERQVRQRHAEIAGDSQEPAVRRRLLPRADPRPEAALHGGGDARLHGERRRRAAEPGAGHVRRGPDDGGRVPVHLLGWKGEARLQGGPGAAGRRRAPGVDALPRGPVRPAARGRDRARARGRRGTVGRRRDGPAGVRERRGRRAAARAPAREPGPGADGRHGRVARAARLAGAAGRARGRHGEHV